MRDNNAPGGDLGRHLRQTAGNELIRQAVKAVAAHALRVEALRNGLMVRQRVVPALERGIEAGNRGNVRDTSEHRADRREIVGLMQRRER